MQFVLRKPRWPLIAISEGQVASILNFADLDSVIARFAAGEIVLYDAEGWKYEYHPSGNFIAPAFVVKRMTKNALLEMVLACNNVTSRDCDLLDKNLNNVRLQELVSRLAQFIKRSIGSASGLTGA